MTIVALGVLSGVLFTIVMFCEIKLAIRAKAYDKTVRTLLGEKKEEEKDNAKH